jgi:hypothetical protein
MIQTALQQQLIGWVDVLKATTAPDAKWPQPTAICLDPFGGLMAREKSMDIIGEKCKVFVHFTPSPTSLAAFLCKGEDGGVLDWEETLDRIVKEKGLDEDGRAATLEKVSPIPLHSSRLSFTKNPILCPPTVTFER